MDSKIEKAKDFVLKEVKNIDRREVVAKAILDDKEIVGSIIVSVEECVRKLYDGKKTIEKQQESTICITAGR